MPSVQKICVELSGDAVRFIHNSDVEEMYTGEMKVDRLSHVEFDEASQSWFIQDSKTLDIVESGFVNRESALEREVELYAVGTDLWSLHS